ncbi:hypothetical protein [Polyangium fumosum]|uniref:Uncharacterized protein n=1 Tax=Polyangium fumosum TaxID=889272 RepID=A0A4U1IV59_9BACT|nr:hypothetical protein [Polyangium fumosum]TKC97991.1 hypothetical protein E8A74_43140 [Polyangium fumosum]
MMDTAAFKAFVAAVERAAIQDIYVTGFIDRGNGVPTDLLPSGSDWLQFTSVWNWLYVRVGNYLFLLETVAQYARLAIERAERIECKFPVEPEDTFGFSSVIRSVLQSGADQAVVVGIDLFCAVNPGPDEGIGAMGLACGKDYIFIDALDYNGIHVGGARSRDLWLEYFGNRYAVKSVSVNSAIA